MKLTINPIETAKRIKKAERVIQGKSIYPILDNFLISVKSNCCTVTSSDGEIQLSLILPIISSDCDFDFCADAKKFSAIMSTIKYGDASIEIEKGEVLFKHKKGKIAIPCVDAKDYPLISLGEQSMSTMVDARELFTAVYGTAYACSTDDLRPQLNGVYFDFVEDGYYTVSTDTHKLVKIKNHDKRGEQIDSFIMPNKVANIVEPLIESINDDVVVSNNGSLGEIVAKNDFRLTFKQASGKYPNYNAVFPKELKDFAIVEKNELIESLRRVLLAASQQVGCVVFKFENNEIHLSSRDLDYNTSAEEVVSCEYAGAPINIAFNGNDLLTILSNLHVSDGLFKVFLFDSAKAIVISPNSNDDTKTQALLMPMYME